MLVYFYEEQNEDYPFANRYTKAFSKYEDALAFLAKRVTEWYVDSLFPAPEKAPSWKEIKKVLSASSDNYVEDDCIVIYSWNGSVLNFDVAAVELE